MNLADRLLHAAERLAGRAAVTLDGVEITYGALERMSGRVATLLRRRGIRAGDRVAVMLPNVPEFAVVYYGVLRIGAVVVPLDPLLRRREIAAYVGGSGARLLIAWHALAETAEAGAVGTGADCFFVVPEEFPGCCAAWRPSPGPPRGRPATPPSSTTPPGRPAGPGASSSPTPTSGATPRRSPGCRRSGWTTSSSARCRSTTPSGRRARSTRPSTPARA
nr:hypothetical protein GCM10020093_010160 [Planobispora longispora]